MNPEYTHLIIDGVIVVILILAGVIGAFRGLFRTVMSVVVVVVSILAASLLSGLASKPLTEWLYPKVEEKINIQVDLSSFLEDIKNEKIEEELAKLPKDVPDSIRKELEKKAKESVTDEMISEYVASLGTDGVVDAIIQSDTYQNLKNALAKSGISDSGIQDYIRKTVEKLDLGSGNLNEAVKAMIRSLAKDAFRILIRTIIFIIIFLVLVFLLNWAVRGLNDLIFKVPVLGFINRAGGAVLGLAFAVILIWVVLLICKGLNFTFFQDHEADTVLLRWLSENNLLLGLLGIKI